MGWPKGKPRGPSPRKFRCPDSKRAYYREWHRQRRRALGQRYRGPDYGPPAPLRAAPAERVSMTWPEYQHNLCWFEGRLIRLQPRCADLLLILLMNRGRTMSKGQLVEGMWPDPDEEPEWAENAINVRFRLLRQLMPGLILTVGTMHSKGALGWLIPISN